jgi:hypothetical protein
MKTSTSTRPGIIRLRRANLGFDAVKSAIDNHLLSTAAKYSTAHNAATSTHPGDLDTITAINSYLDQISPLYPGDPSYNYRDDIHPDQINYIIQSFILDHRGDFYAGPPPIPYDLIGDIIRDYSTSGDLTIITPFTDHAPAILSLDPATRIISPTPAYYAKYPTRP